MTQVLQASHLAKAYGSKRVIEDVSIRVEGNQVIGLLGPNGAGKTTCFYMIVGLVRADQGTVTINDIDVTKQSMAGRAKRGLSYLPQEASIFRKLSVKNNILAILETRKDLNRKQRIAKAQELMEELHITHIAGSKGMALSGGERRRVEIARALATDPQFILLDEPFAGVDPISVGDIKSIITHLQSRGIGVLITDHNVRETLAICDKAYICSGGTIIAEGDAETVLNNQTVKDVYLGQQFSL